MQLMQEIVKQTGNRFEVVTVTATPAKGEPGTLLEQLETIQRHSFTGGDE